MAIGNTLSLLLVIIRRSLGFKGYLSLNALAITLNYQENDRLNGLTCHTVFRVPIAQSGPFSPYLQFHSSL